MRLLPILLSMLLIAACDNKRHVNSSNLGSTFPESNLSNSQTIQLSGIVSSYIDLKNGLTNTDLNKSALGAENMYKGLIALKNGLQIDSSQTDMTELTDKLLISSGKLLAIQDKSCELQRIEFAQTSALLYMLVNKTKLKNVLLYYDYCPMALNNTGAYWMSETAEIENPYFGSKMMECGEITDTIN